MRLPPISPSFQSPTRSSPSTTSLDCIIIIASLSEYPSASPPLHATCIHPSSAPRLSILAEKYPATLLQPPRHIPQTHNHGSFIIASVVFGLGQEGDPNPHPGSRTLNHSGAVRREHARMQASNHKAQRLTSSFVSNRITPERQLFFTD